MLRDAVTDELQRRQTVAETLRDLDTIELDVVDDDGNRFIGRISGSRIAEQDDVAVYVTHDERVVAHNATYGHHAVYERGDVSELPDWLEGGAYVKAMSALGLKAVIDL